MNTKTAIAMGGNIGDIEKSFNEALFMLYKGGLKNIRISSILRNSACDCVSGTPDFKNAALIGLWNKTPEELLALCQKIESTLGRPAAHKSNESRTIDLDIILFGDAQVNTNTLSIPHPRAHLRYFVLYPLNEIAPDWIFPDTDMSMKAALKKLCEEQQT